MWAMRPNAHGRSVRITETRVGEASFCPLRGPFVPEGKRVVSTSANNVGEEAGFPYVKAHKRCLEPVFTIFMTLWLYT